MLRVVFADYLSRKDESSDKNCSQLKTNVSQKDAQQLKECGQLQIQESVKYICAPGYGV